MQAFPPFSCVHAEGGGGEVGRWGGGEVGRRGERSFSGVSDWFIKPCVYQAKKR